MDGTKFKEFGALTATVGSQIYSGYSIYFQIFLELKQTTGSIYMLREDTFPTFLNENLVLSRIDS